MVATDEYVDFESRLQAAAVAPTKKAMSLPQDLQFYRSLDSEFGEDLDACSDRLLNMINKMLAAVDGLSFQGKGKARLETVDDVLDNFNAIVGARIDSLLERTDSCLDEFTGRSKKPTAVAANAVQTVATGQRGSKDRLHPDLQHAAGIAKPQLSFRTPPDNRVESLWRPLLKRKPNALVPLDPAFLLPASTSANAPYQFPHPYAHEIQHITYPTRMFQKQDPQMYGEFEQTPFQWVSTQEQLSQLLQDLEGVSEIAVDLEHHDYRTFSGFLCLMQISTRSKDYIIDALVLREELEALNNVFTDPNVVKVLHGAESDIIWLQQNFGLYVVNLFDTYHASKVLGFPKHSLAALLMTYCNFAADKKYQLADWRIRPLPQEMLEYARSDTHFLLYIYDELRNTLLDRAKGNDDLIRTVLEKSEETALRTYHKEGYDFDTGLGKNGWFNVLQKWNSNLSEMQSAVFKAVHKWRDATAREDDESPRFVLQNNILFRLAAQPPADIVGLKQILNKPSAPVRNRMTGLLEVIRETVRKELSRPPPLSDRPSSSAVAMDGDVPISEVGLAKITQQDQQPLLDVWNRIEGKGTPRAPSSALFGTTLPAGSQNNGKTLTTSSSSLFGGITLSNTTIPARVKEFEAIVEKIHSSIRQAPTITRPAGSNASATNAMDIDGATASAPEPLIQAQNSAMALNFEEVLTSSAVLTQAQTTQTPATEKMVNSAPAQSLDLTFVPASKRGKTKAQGQDDAAGDGEIVQVGKSKKRKRKDTLKAPEVDTGTRGLGDSAASASVAEATPSNEVNGASLHAQEKPAFDFDSVPNILDALPLDGKTGREKRSKKQKRAPAVEYGNFPAPPKNPSEIKSGRTRTFKR